MTEDAPVTRLAIALIRRDGGTQIRAQISMDVAREYAEAMVSGGCATTFAFSAPSFQSTACNWAFWVSSSTKPPWPCKRVSMGS